MTHLRSLASLVVSAVLIIIALWSAGAMVGYTQLADKGGGM